MSVRTIPFTPDQIGTNRVRFPSGAPIPTITDMAVDPYVATRVPKETQVEGIQFWPQEKSTFGGIVLLHEGWGLNNQIKQLGLRLSCEGYAVIIPNLYNRLGGMVTANADVAEGLTARLNEPLTLQDINSCCEFLNTRDYVKRNLHAVVGFGLGGTLALRFACRRKRLRAAVSFYGQLTPNPTILAELQCPVLYHHPEQNPVIPFEELEQFRQAGDTQGKRIAIRRYPEAAPGFCDETRTVTYRETDAQEAWDAMALFLAEHLKV